jgi:hypothetical protein
MGRRGFLLGVLIVAGLAAVALLVRLGLDRSGQTVSSESLRAPATRVERSQDAIAVAVPAARKGELQNPPSAATPDVAADEGHTEPDDEAMAAAWAAVDMDEVRKAMPDNLYWKLSVPTKDPQVLAEREAERARWNVEYGKILSGTASEEEIRAYYDNRARLSGDYIEFATYLLDHYESTLPERDVGMLKLALRLHRARLEEIPRKVEEALERKWTQDAAREAWLKDQAAFGSANSDSGAADANGEQRGE